MKQIWFVGIVSILFIGACSDNPLEAPLGPPVVEKTPKNWDITQAQRNKNKKTYISEHQIAYDWFADFPFSESDGVPYIMLRLLPVLAPEIWGSKENFLDIVGLFNDTRQTNYPMPRGVGFSGLARNDINGNIDYASFTCGACHIGRVRLNNDEYNYIDGGVNTEFNIVLYRVKVFKTLQKIYGDEKDRDKQLKLAESAFIDSLDEEHKKNANFLYNNYNYNGLNFDTSYEAKQIALFKEKASTIISTYVNRAENEYESFRALVHKNYEGFEEEMLKGFGGMADATGISATNGYTAVKEYPVIGWFASSIALPPKPGITDFMAVWEQGKRKARWNEDKTSLINGGGQWNGNIPIPIYRNLAAELTLGLESTDLRIAAFAVDFLDGLPATVYPFDVNESLAKEGETLFAENCAGCHQPHNGKVYAKLGTNLDRSLVVNRLIAYAARKGFTSICSPTTIVVLEDREVKPCAEFDGVSLQGKSEFSMSPVGQHKGYNATPMGGIWAQAPYLHNGSVPTLYHLLVPSERPTAFMKGRLDYDREKVGFSWNPNIPSSTVNEEGYLFDTRAFSAISNAGHDTMVEEDGHTYKLDWSDDKAGANAIIEYMKTL